MGACSSDATALLSPKFFDYLSSQLRGFRCGLIYSSLRLQFFQLAATGQRLTHDRNRVRTPTYLRLSRNSTVCGRKFFSALSSFSYYGIFFFGVTAPQPFALCRLKKAQLLSPRRPV